MIGSFRFASGSSSNGNNLGHFCGSSGPHLLKSPGRYLYLQFHTTTNGLVSNRGFQLTYTIDTDVVVGPVYNGKYSHCVYNLQSLTACILQRKLTLL